jgi:methionine sulfoxide reductase catalytic subunit
MLIKSKDSSFIPSSEITAKGVYVNRRQFLKGSAALGGVALAGGVLGELAFPTAAEAGTKIEGVVKSPMSTTSETQTPYKDITSYNNYYEFSTDKYEPAKLAQNFKTRPWTVTIDGLLKKKLTLDIDEVLKLAAPEERIYRHRCVEGWVHGDALDRIPAECADQESGASAEGEVRAIYDCVRPQANAGTALRRAGLAVHRGPAHG